MRLDFPSRSVRRVVERMTAVIYPARCGVCRQILDPGLSWCSKCWIGLGHAVQRDYCPSCGSTLGPHQPIDSKGRCGLCKKSPRPLDGICRLGAYDHFLSRAIIYFKYNYGLYVGHRLADMLAPGLMEQQWFDQIHAFCPIPIHWTRRLDRGFNQSQILADRLSQKTRLPTIRLLKRVRPTARQVGLSAQARLENISEAFAPRRRWPLKDATVCLIDDVMTTGSTLFEAAQCLRRAGAVKVYAAVIAKADNTFFA